MSGRIAAVFLSVLLPSLSVGAYTIAPGDFTVRGVSGLSVNVLRLDVVTRETPPNGVLTGVDVDYSFDGPWNLTFALRPVVSPGFVDANVGLGVKYRVVQLDAPFIPYASASLTGALGGPLRFGAPHVNLGARGALGMDYFVLRSLAVGVETAFEGSVLAYPLLFPELSAEVLAGITWRF